MSLLSPTESMAFQSFLSSVEHVDGWHGPTPTEWLLYTQGNPDAPDDLHPRAKDALKKATLDLMSLDTSPTSSTSQSSAWPNFPAADPANTAKVQFRYPMGNDDPLYNPKAQARGRPSSSHTPSPGPNPSPPPSQSHSRPPLANQSSSKRSFDKIGSSSSNVSNKRPRSSPKQPSPPPSESSATATARPALLSASQKRANHIQSEQKRRANIRKGYEALCETVPALREAIRKEEEEAAAAGGSTRPTVVTSVKAGGGKRRKSKAVEDDKLDGRAGPKSENVVLQKSVFSLSLLQTIIDMEF